MMASRKRRSSSSVRSPISTSSSGGRGRAALRTSSLRRSRVVPPEPVPCAPASDAAAPPPTNPRYTERPAWSDESAFGVTHCLPGDPWEPTAGANTLRFTSADPDPARPSPQVKSSPLDSLRPRQTPDSCLGVKGSPVQIRPSRLAVKFFRIYLCPCQSQQKSQLIAKRPVQTRAPITCPGLLSGHLPIRQSQRNQQSRGQRSLSHPGSAQRPRQLRTGGHRPRRTSSPQAGRSPGRSSCGTRVGRALTPGLPPTTSDAMAAGMRSAFGRTATTVANDTANALP
jgi:hypothetical protein